MNTLYFNIDGFLKTFFSVKLFCHGNDFITKNAHTYILIDVCRFMHSTESEFKHLLLIMSINECIKILE